MKHITVILAAVLATQLREDDRPGLCPNQLALVPSARRAA
jgi:hypothetical protein